MSAVIQLAVYRLTRSTEFSYMGIKVALVLLLIWRMILQVGLSPYGMATGRGEGRPDFPTDGRLRIGPV